MAPLRSTALPLLVTAALVVGVDLTTKVLAVRDPSLFGGGVIYNPLRPSFAMRLLFVVGTVGVLAGVTRLAATRLHTGIPLLWACGGLLVGGTAGNWVSGVIWDAGVPDFIDRGTRMWNLADFAIGLGWMLAIVSSFGYLVRGFLRLRGAASTDR